MDEKTTKIRLMKAKISACYNAAEEKEKNILGRKLRPPGVRRSTVSADLPSFCRNVVLMWSTRPPTSGRRA